MLIDDDEPDIKRDERRFAVYQHQTETHLKQERQKYQAVLQSNEELNQLVDKMTKERERYKGIQAKNEEMQALVDTVMEEKAEVEKSLSRAEAKLLESES
jgi:isopropylmalate/homocitrate/citramalate synthase